VLSLHSTYEAEVAESKTYRASQVYRSRLCWYG
jgi:hypothetical protein